MTKKRKIIIASFVVLIFFGLFAIFMQFAVCRPIMNRHSDNICYLSASTADVKPSCIVLTSKTPERKIQMFWKTSLYDS